MAGTARQRRIRRALRELAPLVPFDVARGVEERAGSRAMRALPVEIAVWLSLAAHARHGFTDYDRLLAEGYDQTSARHFVAEEMQEVLTAWGCRRSLSDDAQE
jgi:hypothetical protein